MKRKIQKKPKKRRTEKSAGIRGFMLSTAKSLAVFAVLLLLSAFFCYKFDVGQKAYLTIMLVICAVSSLISGIFASKSLKQKGIVNGILGSLPLIAVTAILSLILSSFDFSVKLVAACFVMLTCGAAGGILKANKRR